MRRHLVICRGSPLIETVAEMRPSLLEHFSKLKALEALELVAPSSQGERPVILVCVHGEACARCKADGWRVQVAVAAPVAVSASTAGFLVDFLKSFSFSSNLQEPERLEIRARIQDVAEEEEEDDEEEENEEEKKTRRRRKKPARRMSVRLDYVYFILKWLGMSQEAEEHLEAFAEEFLLMVQCPLADVTWFWIKNRCLHQHPAGAVFSLNQIPLCIRVRYLCASGAARAPLVSERIRARLPSPLAELRPFLVAHEVVVFGAAAAAVAADDFFFFASSSSTSSTSSTSSSSLKFEDEVTAVEVVVLSKPSSSSNFSKSSKNKNKNKKIFKNRSSETEIAAILTRELGFIPEPSLSSKTKTERVFVRGKFKIKLRKSPAQSVAALLQTPDRIASDLCVFDGCCVMFAPLCVEAHLFNLNFNQ